MALDEAGLKTALLALMDKPNDAGITADAAATALAAAIVTCIKTATVMPTTMTAAGFGAPVIGTGTLL